MSPKKLLKYLSLIYIFQIVLYVLGPIDFGTLPLRIIWIITVTNLLIYIGIWTSNKIAIEPKKQFLSLGLSRLFLWATLIGISLRLAQKVRELGLSGILSLNAIISARLEKSFNGAEMGQSFIGIIGTIFLGFGFVYISLNAVNRSKKLLRRARLIFFVSLGVSLLDGGRFGLVIGILFFIITSLNWRDKAVRMNRQRKLFLIAMVIIVLLGISQIFILKLGLHDTDLINAVRLSTGKELRYELSFLPKGIAAVIYMMNYYFVHSLFELQVFLEYYTDSKVFLGAYQYYPFFLALSKLGLQVTPITEILNTIPNPGVYFTIIPAFILDFGMAAPLAFWLLGLFTGLSLKLTGERAFIGVLFTLIILFSPFLSLMGTSIFPSIIVSVVLYLLLYECGKS